MDKPTNIKSPFTGGKVTEHTTVERMDYKGEQYDVPVSFYVCEDTREQFTTTEQDERWYNNLHTQYEQRHIVKPYCKSNITK